MELAERIKTAREYTGISKEQVCGALSVDPSELDAWEAGEREPSLAQITKMCDVLQISSDYILLGKDPEGK